MLGQSSVRSDGACIKAFARFVTRKLLVGFIADSAPLSTFAANLLSNGNHFTSSLIEISNGKSNNDNNHRPL